MQHETKITLGDQEIEDIQFALQCGVSRLNASNPADFAQLCRLTAMWQRLDYIRTHDDLGRPREDV